jgi:hypothetical protein
MTAEYYQTRPRGGVRRHVVNATDGFEVLTPCADATARMRFSALLILCMQSGSDLIGLSYCSTATFQCAGRPMGVNEDVQQILVESRRKNTYNDDQRRPAFCGRPFLPVSGGTCRPGRCAVRQDLPGRPAHRCASLDPPARCPGRRFGGLPMKYVSVERPIERVLERHGLRCFDPDRFTPALIEDLVMNSIPERECAPQADPERSSNRAPASGSGCCDDSPGRQLALPLLSPIHRARSFQIGLPCGPISTGQCPGRRGPWGRTLELRRYSFVRRERRVQPRRARCRLVK